MPRIVRAEFLSHYNPTRNSDKVFNVFVIEDDDNTFRCVTEYGRRGNSLVRDTLCTRATRDAADSKLRQKLAAKRSHRETPYTDEPFGYNYSPLAGEYGFNRSQSSFEIPAEDTQITANNKNSEPKPNIVAFPADKITKPRREPKQSGILNQEQFDSLEI